MRNTRIDGSRKCLCCNGALLAGCFLASGVLAVGEEECKQDHEDWSGRYVDVAKMDALARKVEQRLVEEANPKTFHRYQALALAFTAGKEYDRPFVNVELDAEITAPNGTTYRLPAFYDGKGVWKIRFMPYEKGQYRVRTECNHTDDTGLHGKSATFDVSESLPGTDLSVHGGHLRVGKNKRHLALHDGTPFFWLSDTYWFVPTRMMPYDSSSNPHFKSMYQLCVMLRKKQRFNALTVGFLGDRPELQAGFEGNSSDFHGKDDLFMLDKWTEQAVDWWRQADRYFLYANGAGMVVTMNMIWASDFNAYAKKGKTDKDLVDMVKPLHRYVMARLGSYNILWHVTAEYNHSANKGKIRAAHLDVGSYIRSIDPYKDRPMTVFPWPGHMANADDAFAEPWYEIRLAQGAHYRHRWEVAGRKWMLDWYNHPRVMPFLAGEHNFERIYEKKNDSGDVRAAAWRGMMCGSCGYTYGATGLWYPNRDETDKTMGHWGNVPWWQALDYPGAPQMGIMRTFFEGYRWWEMTPAMDRLTITPAPPKEYAYPTALCLGDKLLMVYIPGALPLANTLRLQAEGPGRLSWFNPRDGSKTDGGVLADENGNVTLPPRPDALDWVAVFELR